MSAQAVKPTADPSNPASPNARPVYKNPPRESHPTELLTHQFVPYGATVANVERDAGTPAPMEIDGEVLMPETPAKVKPDSKKSKGKKRKGDGAEPDSPKKTKKAKTTS
jgi:hypothetical protein